MYGDPQAVHGLARQVRVLAEHTRAVAAQVQAARSVSWQSDLAERLRRDLVEHADGTRAAAEGLDALATALDQHADAVAERLAQIRAAERYLAALLDSARRRAVVAAESMAATVREGATDAAVTVARRGEQLAAGTLRELRQAPASGSAELVGFVRHLGFPGGW